MSGLSEAIDAERAVQQKTGLPCSVAIVLAALDDDDRAALTTAIEDRAITGPAIIAALRSQDIPGKIPSQDGLGKHRRHLCRCWSGK